MTKNFQIPYIFFLYGDCISSFRGLKNSLFILVAKEERVDLQPGELLPTASDLVAASYEIILKIG